MTESITITGSDQLPYFTTLSKNRSSGDGPLMRYKSLEDISFSAPIIHYNSELFCLHSCSCQDIVIEPCEEDFIKMKLMELLGKVD